jgi:outer membrane receptor protein involved in Fe transport
MRTRRTVGAVVSGVLAIAAPLHAHPKHPAGDPAEPTGNRDDSPPDVPGIDQRPAAPQTQPAEVQGLTDAQLLAISHAAANETIVVEGDAPAESASSIHLDYEKLSRRSRTQMSDVLRQVPGLMVSQHAGGGKSDQYFIRGFDADHGTDIAIFADVIQVNLTSHGHGQGYADTHWLIPETIGSVDMHKGPYAARYGDFYTAGALELNTLDELDGATSTVWLAGGVPLGARGLSAVDRRMVGIASPKLREGDKTLLAVEIGEQDGAFTNPQDFQRAIAMGKWQGRVGKGRLELETNWYTGRWNQSGQIPASLVADGSLDRFGAIDPSEGGTASRGSVKVGYELPAGEGGSVRVAAYGVGNKLDLFSNFTLYARDSVHGDQIEQTDSRLLYGLDAKYEKSIHKAAFDALITTGVQMRADDVSTSLWQAERRQRLAMCFDGMVNPCNRHDSSVRDLAAYAEANVIPTPWLHLFPGVRVDHFRWAVTDRAMPMAETFGDASRTLVSPKLSVELHPTDQVNLFINSGAGFHSNDARAAVATNGAGSLARAWGGEIGARVKPTKSSRVSMDVWYLHLSSEQVWNGDAGGTEPSDPTRRLGLDLEGSTDVTSWLSLDANITFAQARFVANAGNGGAIALAPRWMGSGGITAKRGKSFIALRSRGIADRPGNEDGSLVAEGYLLFDLVAGTQRGGWGLNLTLNNVTNTEWREAQFAEESRVAPSADLAEQMHFTPGIPLTATATASYAW